VPSRPTREGKRLVMIFRVLAGPPWESGKKLGGCTPAHILGRGSTALRFLQAAGEGRVKEAPKCRRELQQSSEERPEKRRPERFRNHAETTRRQLHSGSRRIRDDVGGPLLECQKLMRRKMVTIQSFHKVEEFGGQRTKNVLDG